jgi:S-DNA-T family DNA segregation ATPase FtsK/SpoIIIE
VFDGKGSPDWRKFALVAYTYGFGLLPDRVQGDPIENLRATLRQAKTDVLMRNVKLSELPTARLPGRGKLTRDIARDPRYGMPVWLIVLDEFQEYLNTGDPEADLEIADLLLFLVKVGPSVGIILIS